MFRSCFMNGDKSIVGLVLTMMVLCEYRNIIDNARCGDSVVCGMTFLLVMMSLTIDFSLTLCNDMLGLPFRRKRMYLCRDCFKMVLNRFDLANYLCVIWCKASWVSGFVKVDMLDCNCM